MSIIVAFIFFFKQHQHSAVSGLTNNVFCCCEKSVRELGNFLDLAKIKPERERVRY